MLTRIFTIVAASLVATTSYAALGDNSFNNLDRFRDNSSVIELGTVRSEGDGVVELYSYRGNEIGPLIGMQRVHEGANPHVRIKAGNQPAMSDVIAILKVDGRTVATSEFQVSDR